MEAERLQELRLRSLWMRTRKKTKLRRTMMIKPTILSVRRFHSILRSCSRGQTMLQTRSSPTPEYAEEEKAFWHHHGSAHLDAKTRASRIMTRSGQVPAGAFQPLGAFPAFSHGDLWHVLFTTPGSHCREKHGMGSITFLFGASTTSGVTLEL